MGKVKSLSCRRIFVRTNNWIQNVEQNTTLGINYEELYECKWDPMTLTNNTLYTLAFKFYKSFGPMMVCIEQK